MDRDLLTFLVDLKQYGLEQDIPNVTERGGQFLNFLVRMSGAKSILEIGSANGYSTIWLAEAVQKNDGRLTTVDFSEPTFMQAKDNLKKVGFDSVVDFHFGNALQVIPGFEADRRFDFLFVDGQKNSYWDFWQVSKPFLEKGALIVFDDVMAFPEKTQSFLEKIKTETAYEQLTIPLDGDDGILLLYET